MTNLQGKRCLVTGGLGFIGSHLVNRLWDAGAIVIIVDDESSQSLLRGEDHVQAHQIYKLSVGAWLAKYGKKCEPIDIVFHLAACKKTRSDNVFLDLDSNARQTLRLLEWTRHHGVKKFVHASTGSVYGEMPERVDEYSLCRPVSHYGVSKLAGERYVALYNRLYGLNTTILRYFQVYGPRQDYSEYGGVIPRFIAQVLRGETPTIYGTGKQYRSFTWVGDVVAATLRAANLDCYGAVYNVASGVSISILYLVNLIYDMVYTDMLESPQVFKSGVLTLGDIYHVNVSSKLICAELGMKFDTDFDARLRDTFEWYKGLLKVV